MGRKCTESGSAPLFTVVGESVLGSVLETFGMHVACSACTEVGCGRSAFVLQCGSAVQALQLTCARTGTCGYHQGLDVGSRTCADIHGSLCAMNSSHVHAGNAP